MRLVLAFLLIPSLALAQKHAGKTCDEILMMGHDKWFDFYTDKVGSTTVDMSDASNTFAECLAKRNTAALPKLPEVDRKWVTEQHAIARKISMDLYTLEARDGGTLYVIVAAMDNVRGQELLAKLIKVGTARSSPTAAQAKRMSTLSAGALKNFGVLERLLKKERDWTRPGGQTKQQLLQWAAAARTGFEKWLAQRAPNRAAGNLLLLEHIYEATLPANFGP